MNTCNISRIFLVSIMDDISDYVYLEMNASIVIVEKNVVQISNVKMFMIPRLQ